MKGSRAFEQDSATCRLCNEAFEKPSFLLNHLKTAHTIGPQVKNNLICPLCGIRNTEYHSHRDHLLYCHRHKTVGTKQGFKTFSDFLVWKNELELQQETKYVCQNSCNIISKNYKRYYYQCCHSGVFRAGSIANKFKTRMESTCPSMISVIEYADSNEVKVEFWDVHFGHRGTEESNENSNAEDSTAGSFKEADDLSIENIYIVNSDKDNLIKTTGKSNELASQNSLNSSESAGKGSSPLKTVPFIPNTIFRSSPVSILKTSTDNSKKIKHYFPEEQSSKKPIKSKFNEKNTEKINDKSNGAKPAVVMNNNTPMPSVNSNDMSNGNQIILINTLPNGQPAPVNGNICTITPNNTLLNMVALNGSPGNPVFLNSALGTPTYIPASNMIQSALPKNLISSLNSQAPTGQIFYTTVPVTTQMTSTSNNSTACSDTTSTTSSKILPVAKSATNLLPSGEPCLWKKVPINASPSKKKNKLPSTSPSTSVPSLSTGNMTSILKNSEVNSSFQGLSAVATTSAISDKNIPAGKIPISRINTFRNQIATSVPAGNQMILINSMPFSQVSQAGGNICTLTPTTMIGTNGAPIQMYVNSSSVNPTCFPAANNLVSVQSSLLPTNLTSGVSSQASLSQVYSTKTPHVSQSSLSSKVPGKKRNISRSDKSVSPDKDQNELFGMDDNSMGSSSEDDAMSTDDNLVGFDASTNSSDTQSSFSNLVSVACSKDKIAVPSNQLLSSKSLTNTKVAAGFDATQNVIFRKDEHTLNDQPKSGACKVQVSGAVAKTLIGNFSVRSYASTKPKEIEKPSSKPTSTSPPKPTKSKASHQLTQKTLPSSKFARPTAISLPTKSSPIATSQSSIKTSSVLNSNIDKTLNRTSSNTVLGTMTSNVITSKTLNNDITNKDKCNNDVQPLSVTTVPLSLLQNTQNSTIVIPGSSNSETTLIEDSGNLYILEPIEDKEIPTSSSDSFTVVSETNMESRLNVTRTASTVKNDRLQYSPIKTQSTDVSKSKEKFNSDTHILQKIENYKLEMKYLASQEECKRLKIELAKAELKTHVKDKDVPEHRNNKEQEIEDTNLKARNTVQVSLQALESRFSSDDDLDIYNLVRSSVLRNLNESLKDLSEMNKQLSNENKQLSDEIENYRKKDVFYKLLTEEDF